MPANPSEGHIFRSAAYLAAQEARKALEQAELEAEEARRNVEERAAKVAEYEAAEEDRLLDVRSREMRSRVQASRARVSAMITVAEQLQTAIATTGRLWKDFQDELAGFNALCPPEFSVPDFSRHNLDDLIFGEYLRGTVEGGWAIPGAALVSDLPPPLSEAIDAAGKQACLDLGHALGIRPRKATAGEPV